jgi:hypothetical protein
MDTALLDYAIVAAVREPPVHTDNTIEPKVKSGILPMWGAVRDWINQPLHRAYGEVSSP